MPICMIDLRWRMVPVAASAQSILLTNSVACFFLANFELLIFAILLLVEQPRSGLRGLHEASSSHRRSRSGRAEHDPAVSRL